jgi:hypothetical protein
MENIEGKTILVLLLCFGFVVVFLYFKISGGMLFGDLYCSYLRVGLRFCILVLEQLGC